MLSRIGPTELLLILFIALLIFGPTKLPKIGKAIGQAIGNFKRGASRAEKRGDKSENDES